MTVHEADEEGSLSASSFRSVPDLWNYRVGSTPGGEALVHRTRSGWATLTWRQADQRVRQIANALLAEGLKPEDRCCIASETRVEWVLADLAILNAGGATTTLYPSSTSDDSVHILQDSGSRVVFVDTNAQAKRLLDVRDRIPAVQRVIVFDGTPSDDGWIRTLAMFEATGRAHALEEPEAYPNAASAVQPGALATLIYTSGTTGEPKGVMLTHASWIHQADAMDRLGVMTPADRQLLMLPLAHVFAKVLQVAFIRLGMPTVIDGDRTTLADTLQTQRPTWMASVPRAFEKMQDTIETEVRKRGFVKRRVFARALRLGRQASKLQQQGRPLPLTLRAKLAVAERTVFSPIRERFGGRVRFFISGGAPLSPETAAFFHALGILVLEGWGLTESAGASCVNTPDSYTFGTVGRPMPGCHIQIAPDGEVLIRSPAMMTGYHNDPIGTEEAITDDGWLRTGDIGTLLDNGHLQITDRKKDIIVTAGGKNVAPAHFQGLLKQRCSFVEDVLMVGDRRPYCTALVTLDLEHVQSWAQGQGLSARTYAELAVLPVVKALIQAHVDEVNGTLPRYETVKRFAVLDAPLSLADGSLTASSKVRRPVVEARYADVIEAFYSTDDRP